MSQATTWLKVSAQWTSLHGHGRSARECQRGGWDSNSTARAASRLSLVSAQDGWYWLNDARDGWLAVQFDEQAGDTVTLKTAEGEAYDMPTSTVLRPALASSLRPHSNLLELEELHEGAILHALRTRYGQDEIYTSISEIVISINPYKQLPIYGPNQIAKYRRGLRSGQEAGATTTTGAATQLAPHVYAVADAAYTSMLRDESNQAILISGESGAGPCRQQTEESSFAVC